MLRQRLLLLRNSKKLTQQQVATYLKISRQAYGFYEEGRRLPSIEILYNIALLYNVSIDYLCGLTDVPAKYKPDTLNEDFILYIYKQLDPSVQSALICIMKRFQDNFTKSWLYFYFYDIRLSYLLS